MRCFIDFVKSILGIGRTKRLSYDLMKADADTEAAVMGTINKSFEAYANRDVEGVLALLVPVPDVVAIGTGADEKCIGLEETRRQLERDFAQSEGGSWKMDWHLVSAAGPVAWVAADVTMYARVAGKDLSAPIRFTAVLVQHGDKWLFAQQHISMAAAGQRVGQSFPT